MSGVRNFLMGCALSLASVVPTVSAQAIPLAAPQMPAVEKSNVETVSHRRWHRPPHYGHRRYYRPGVRLYVEPRPIYRPRAVRRGYGGHVNWCLSRYRSYNPATNRFLAYGGVYRVCRSPYR